MKARAQAAKTLSRILDEGAYSNLETRRVLSEGGLAPEDRGLYLNIVYGTIQNLYYLDYLLGKYVKREFAQLDAEVLMTLRAAVYQLRFLDKVPDYAVVNEAVASAPKRARGFVNGVLRSLLRDREALAAFDAGAFANEKEALSVRYSLPVWIVHKYYEAYGQEKAEAIIPKINDKPPFTIRVNTLKISREKLMEALEALGIKAVPGTLDPDALHLEQVGVFEGKIQKSPLFAQGYFTIQDQAAMAAASLLAPKAGERVLDLCAAPGGKTTHLAQLMENCGQIVARDVTDSRLTLIDETAARLGVKIIETQKADGTVFRPEDQQAYDAILLDAPCSGLGIVRRKPEIRYGMDKKARRALCAIQAKLLDNAAAYLKPGGRLVYSTCTINGDENEGQIRKFLDRHPEMVCVSDLKDKDALYTSPLKDNADGFFICALKKEV
ncbi:MAG: 16S rRNA (cytosine(967)-C(5))-methyltransferase RsmB [Eubacterium sp.]|nr:16S rRNA (cytosine(967)-C(5))-methyltransferase RsmB [Eubacterium sp.]